MTADYMDFGVRCAGCPALFNWI